jgi:hypothetical protein
MGYRASRRRTTLLVIVLCALVFSLFTVIVQSREMGFDKLQEGGFQVDNHQKMLDGQRGNPFQYRILSEWLVELFIIAFKQSALPFPSAIGFLTFRILQNVFIFVFAAYYYKKLGLTTYSAILGLGLLAYSFTQALYGADLQFNTYSDILFYMAAGLAIVYRREGWIIPITVLAAFNRETSGLIPVLLIAAHLQLKPKIAVLPRILIIGGIAMALYAAIFIGLRIEYGPEELLVPYGNHIGLELLIYNLTLPATYVELFGVLGLLPIMAILSIRRWPDALVLFFWALAPIWFLIHLFASVLAESRLVLVPQALIFIPGALLGVTTLYERAYLPTQPTETVPTTNR